MASGSGLGGFGLELPVGAQGVNVSAWFADGDPASDDPVDPDIGDPREFADSDAEVDFSASALGRDEQVEDRRPQDQPGDQGERCDLQDRICSRCLYE